jgi:pimeloyl-ACP methyl ester carboxylesterase
MFKQNEAGAPVLDYDPLIFGRASRILIWLTAPLVWAAFRRLAKAGPLLLIRGALTDIVDAPTVRGMQRLAPNMVVAEIPGVGHAPMLDETEARAALATFLESAP